MDAFGMEYAAACNNAYCLDVSCNKAGTGFPGGGGHRCGSHLTPGSPVDDTDPSLFRGGSGGAPSTRGVGADPGFNTADDSGLRPDLGESDGCNALVCVERGAAALCCDRTDCSTAAVLRSIIPFEAAAKVKAVDSPITTSVDSLASVFSRLGGDGLFNTGMGRGFALLYGIHILLIG